MKIINQPEIIQQYLTLPQYQQLFPENINEHVCLFHYQANETIIAQSAIPEYLYCLVYGKCVIREYFENGKSMILNTIRPFSLLGEIELVNSDDLSLSVVALTDCNLLAIPVDICKEILLNDCNFLRKLTTLLAKKERYASKKLARSFGYPLSNRLAYFILENKQGDLLTIRKVEIAESLGVSYRHIENMMNSFINQGYLEYYKPDYLISNMDGLKQLAEVCKNSQ